MDEVWKPIPGFEGAYEVSNLGRVRSLDRKVYVAHPERPYWRRTPGKTIAPQTHVGGYLQVYLPGGVRLVHRLVAAAFMGECPEGHECAHINGDRTDNRTENLMYARHVENLAHQIAHGTRLYGERNPGAVLTAQEVHRIRSMRAAGKTYAEIAAKFLVTDRTVGKIIRLERWKHV